MGNGSNRIGELDALTLPSICEGIGLHVTTSYTGECF